MNKEYTDDKHQWGAPQYLDYVEVSSLIPKPLDVEGLERTLKDAYTEHHQLCVCDGLFREMAGFIASRFCAPQQWISVDDRLPEENEIVMVHINIGWALGHMYRGAFMSEGKWWFNEYGTLLDVDFYEVSDGGYDDDITHWMPLPEPPAAK